MTVIDPNIWSYDSPLDEEQELEINFIDPFIYQAEFEEFPLHSMRQRMIVIMLIASVVVLSFGLLVMPQMFAHLTLAANGVGTESSHDSTAVNANRSAQPVTQISGQISPIFSPEVQYWGPQIVQWAAAQNLDPNMVATVMQIESCGDPNALSSAGAQGLFQVMPFHFANGENAMDPDTNALRGVAYLAERLVQTNGDVGRAFAGYNGGHVAAGTSYDNWANETQRYYRWSTTIYADVQAGLTESPALAEWMAAGGASLCNQASTRLGIQ